MTFVIIIGSGFGGICTAIHLKKNGIKDFLILEKADSLGGTWRDNTYPGAECDVPSALYSFSFEKYPDWSYKWSHQDQILNYLDQCVNKHHLAEHIIYNEEVDEASFDDFNHLWRVTTKTQKEYRCRILVSAIGQLHHPACPDLPGIESFQGTVFHSARWNHEVSLHRKRVGIIGTGASAVQIIPELAEVASSVHVFQRSANWILPKLDRPYYQWEKTLRRIFPGILFVERSILWLKAGLLFFLMKRVSPLRRLMEWRSRIYMRRHITHDMKRELLTPTYPMGAKRVLFSDSFYQALAQENVHLHPGGDIRFDNAGILLSNGHIDLDVVVMATGFKTNPFFHFMTLNGRGGLPISKHWKNDERNFLGMVTSRFPNLFMIYGPNTNLGHNSIIIMFEAQAKYIAQALTFLQTNELVELEVKEDIEEAYYVEIQERLQQMIWASLSESWYMKEGRISNNWPGRTMEYSRRTRKFDSNDYHFYKDESREIEWINTKAGG